MAVTTCATTDVGLLREQNEDSYFAGTTVFAVADGLGGHAAGEVASAIAVEVVSRLDGHEFATSDEARDALVQAAREANAEILKRAAAEPDQAGMGTTLTAALLHEERVYLAHVGDSRGYLRRGDEPLRRVTTDHTLVEGFVRQGLLSPEEAAVHPERSVLTQALGLDEDVLVDAVEPPSPRPGDVLLLCSDGLTEPLTDDEIDQVLTASAERPCEDLVAAANAAGGPDNITVVVLRWR
ncbi:MAG: Stp1/IreP family PP2C-type Ser/Thr phosphatase [Actinomycetota bacterium]|nr:Stp1/IreP family PP2C-type Ser/Thr phosphatase [Actinomycetota bacterium]